jgi:hypothetical protein
MTQIINWFLTSSADRENYSLFIKSAAALVVLFGVDSAVVNDAGNQIANVIVAVGMLISAITALVGLVRKVKLGQWSAAN